MEQLIDAGGTLRVADPGREVRAAYRRALASVPSGSIPAGKRIRHRGRDRGDLVIELVEAVEPAPEGDRPMPIPQALNPDDALIRHLMQHRELIAVSDASRERALLLVQALAEESRRRGHLARPADRATLEFVIRGEAIGATIAEERVKVSRVPADQVCAAKYDWQRIPAVEVLAFNGRLALTLLTTDWKPPTWADRQRWTLDSRLPQVIRRAEETIDAHIQAREQEEHARTERRRLWDEAVPRARRDYVDHLNRGRLDQQVAAHAKSQALRAYAAAIQERVMQLPDGQEREEAVAWVEWIRVEAQRLDPLVDAQALRYVIPDELPVSEVSKFMPRGMSAYHPPD